MMGGEVRFWNKRLFSSGVEGERAMVRPLTRAAWHAFWLFLLLGALGTGWRLQAEEPPALNPFGPVKQDREDAVPGYLEMSNGKVYTGNVYMTRDKRLKIYDEKMQRQREIPLSKVSKIECQVKKEWMEKEWRFKELALDEKVYTGRSYPAREYVHTITLTDGRTITGPLAELIYVQPYTYSPREATGYRPEVEPQKFPIHKRDKGEMGTDLKSLLYVKVIKLGKEALEEGKKKASAYRPPATPGS